MSKRRIYPMLRFSKRPLYYFAYCWFVLGFTALSIFPWFPTATLAAGANQVSLTSAFSDDSTSRAISAPALGQQTGASLAATDDEDRTTKETGAEEIPTTRTSSKGSKPAPGVQTQPARGGRDI